MFTLLKSHLVVLRPSEQPDYILRFLISQIEQGNLAPGYKLPSVRELSSQLQINYATVQKAYHQCKLAGVITSRPGKGSFISRRGIVEALQTSHDLTSMNSPLSEHSEALSLELKQQAISSVYDYDFRKIFRYQSTLDNVDIRQTGLDWLGKKVLQPSVNRILPCAGIHEGLLALFILHQRKGTIALPHYFYSGLKSIIQLMATPYVTIPCDEEGPLPEALAKLCQENQISALYINPNINNPTTVTLSINRRLALAEVAKRYHLSIIEDDAYGALSSQGIATFSQILPSQTWYLNGLSKSFAPGMRMAWVYGPSEADTHQLCQVMGALKVGDNPLTHQIVHKWISSGVAQRTAEETLKATRVRVKLFCRLFPDDNFKISEDGFHVWFSLGKKNAYEIAFLLQQAGISATPSNEFSFEKNDESFLRISLSGYSSLSALEIALKKFRDVLNTLYLKQTQI
ncbi:aminotransferase-like domain-containing protein [Tatumella ptyseos]|uniref:aminotransferase-like domain-containing protein n=1 Tax=Tatumella ptyseos TaxID=82987 RepID=UPI0026F16D3F|nr:PLP-dependent aminotransferase family protein [Tatumella ptyseos]WKX26447.1 PLP-dependent aminotransferase family protein [Tatumella ptyseos]